MQIAFHHDPGSRIRLLLASLAGAALAALPLLSAGAAQGQTATLHTLYNFTGGADGALPYRGLAMDGAGNLYGATRYGADNCAESYYYQNIGCGTVFKLSPEGVLTPLITFTGPNGAAPNGNPTLKGSVLYSTTYSGGAYDGGTLFEVHTNGKDFAVLWSFSGPDGSLPSALPRIDKAGNLYGTASYGGPGYTSGQSTSGDGVLYKLDPSTKTFTHLHDFTGGADGSEPSRLFPDSKFNLFSTTNAGGVCASGTPGGTIFEYSSTGAFETLYTFCGTTDGSDPGLAGVDGKGNLFGYTYGGGANGVGTLFELEKGKTGYTFVKLYDFTGGADGANPNTYPALTKDDEMIGVTLYGPNPGDNEGVLYSFTPSTRTFTTLWTFTGGADGGYPQATPILDKSGDIYATTPYGGSDIPCTEASGGANISSLGCGTVFRYGP